MRTTGRFRFVLFLFILASFFVYSCSMSDGPALEISQESTLVIELAGEYVEAPGPSVLARIAGQQTRPFLGLLSMFSRAERDARLATVVLRIQPLRIGWGKADELREAIARLRARGLHTVAHLEIQGFSANKELFIASAADEVYVAPGAAMPLVGLAAEYLFLGGFWEQLGVEFDIAKVGRYKSAVEVFAERTMSEASREMADSLLDDTYDRFVTGLSEGRGLTRGAVEAAIDSGTIRNQQFEAAGLIDGELHLDQLLDRFGPDVVEHADYARVDPEDLGFEAEAEFALIYGRGPVVQGEADGSALSGSPAFASQTIADAILEAASDPAIRAILFRIDSPGGSALASELIWRAIDRAQESGTPVIASFSDVAASGGYYVASGAEGIVSDPGTLTGSIGVYALRPVLGGLLDKLEIGIDSLTRGRHADFLLSSEKMSPATLARLQTTVLDTYQLFLTRVADGRSMSIDAVDRIGQGRVWTGRQAYEAGLVDELGGLYTAARRAKRAVGLDEDADVYLVPFPRPASLSEQIFAAFQSTALARVAPLFDWPAPLAGLIEMAGALPTGSALLIPPVLIEIR
ncbi:MAG: signal peptide peptidase SppA [bacterium]|nr:signal peptide peptidase SppA [Deltaproteobacteria bacterium]MCP4908593.1 signal peptide peptidase SppA [bacterium]